MWNGHGRNGGDLAIADHAGLWLHGDGQRRFSASVTEYGGLRSCEGYYQTGNQRSIGSNALPGSADDPQGRYLHSDVLADCNHSHTTWDTSHNDTVSARD